MKRWPARSGIIVLIGMGLAALWWWPNPKSRPLSVVEVAPASAVSSRSSEATLSDHKAIASVPFSDEETPSSSDAAADARVIIGRVVSPRGEGIAGALIDLHSDPARGEFVAIDTPRLQRVVSDSSGSFRIEGILRTEAYRLRIEHNRYRVGHVRPVHAADPETLRPEVRLMEGTSLQGVVRDLAGAPVAGASIEVESIEAPGSPPLTRFERSVTSGADGTFVLPHLAPGAKRVVAAAAGYASVSEAPVRVGPGAIPRSLTMVFSDELTLAGIVIEGAGGAPVHDARVVARIAGAFTGTDSAALGDEKEPRSSEAPPALSVRPAGSTRSIEPGEAVPVMTSDGGMTMKPVWPQELASRAFLTVSAVTGPDGRFVLRGLTKAAYVLSIDDPLHETEHEWVCMAGASGVVLDARPRPSVAGRVLDRDTGAAVTGFAVAVSESADPSLIPLEQRHHVTDADGRFGPLPAKEGAQYVHVWANGYAFGSSERHHLGRGAHEDDVLVQLGRGGVVTGRVLGPDAHPTPGAVVTLMEELPPRRNPSEFVFALAKRSIGAFQGFRCVTDDAGRYRIEGIPAGRFQSRVTHPSLAEALSEPVLCEGAGEVTVPDVTLVAGSTIAGRVLGALDRPWRVLVAGLDLAAPTRTVVAAADGTFRCAGLPCGDYRVFPFVAGLPDADAVLAGVTATTTVTLGPNEERTGLTLGREPVPFSAAPVPPKSGE